MHPEFQHGSDFSPSSIAAEWSANDTKKYVLIIIRLLGANIVIGLVLLVFGVLGCVKRSARVGSKPQYIPVPNKVGEGDQPTYTYYWVFSTLSSGTLLTVPVCTYVQVENRYP